jgi:hypothetical protein
MIWDVPEHAASISRTEGGGGRSSQMLVSVYQIAQHYIPEDFSFNNFNVFWGIVIPSDISNSGKVFHYNLKFRIFNLLMKFYTCLSIITQISVNSHGCT